MINIATALGGLNLRMFYIRLGPSSIGTKNMLFYLQGHEGKSDDDFNDVDLMALRA